MLTIDTLYPEVYTLQEDNATCHKSKFSTNWKKERNIKLIDWPANSPDLNQIENTWGLMKTLLSAERFNTVEEWRQRIYEMWNNFTDNYMQAMFGSMSRRIEAVIKNKGKKCTY